MEDIKEIALNAIKEHYARIHREYSANDPKAFKKIEYFTEWLKTATTNDITVEEKTAHLRPGKFVCRLHGERQYGGTIQDISGNYTIETMITDDPALKDISGTVYDPKYAQYANSDVLPPLSFDEKKVIGNYLFSLARPIYERDNPDHKFNYVASRVLERDFGEPTEYKYLQCQLKYPRQNKTLTMNFIVLDGKYGHGDLPETDIANPVLRIALKTILFPFRVVILFIAGMFGYDPSKKD